MTRLIDAEALKKHKVYSEERHEYIVPVYNIDNAPAFEMPNWYKVYEDVKSTFERQQGEWTEDGFCLKCGKSCLSDSWGRGVKSAFCPWCGADMTKGGTE